MAVSFPPMTDDDVQQGDFSPGWDYDDDPDSGGFGFGDYSPVDETQSDPGNGNSPGNSSPGSPSPSQGGGGVWNELGGVLNGASPVLKSIRDLLFPPAVAPKGSTKPKGTTNVSGSNNGLIIAAIAIVGVVLLARS